MKNIVLDGVEYTPVIITEPVKVGRWKPEIIRDIYYYISCDGGILHLSWLKSSADNSRYLMGNVYQTEELAVAARDKQKLMVEIQDFADEYNAGKKARNGGDEHYILTKRLDGWKPVLTLYNLLGTINFFNQEDCEGAISLFGSRLDLLV